MELVIKKVDPEVLLELNVNNASFSIKEFQFEGKDYLTVYTSSKVFLNLLRYKLLDEETRRIFG